VSGCPNILKLLPQVKRVHIYPTFNSSNYLGDIALLQLSSDVDYSMYVRPVCLWDDSTAPLQLSAVEGRDGTVSTTAVNLS
jgi:Trypsin.